jgi:hypothetical protein
LANGDPERIRDRCTCFDLSITPTLQPDVTGLIEDLRLKDGMAISAPVKCGFTHLHTEGLHHLNGLFFTVTPTLLNMLKIDTYVRFLALTYRQEVMNCKPQWVETPPKVYTHEGVMKNIVRINISLLIILLCVFAFHKPSLALSCGRFDYPKFDGPDLQYAGGFNPQVGFGGFGGGACRADRTPVIFVHGNGDWAINWDSPITGSVKITLRPPAPPIRNSSHGIIMIASSSE